MTNDSVDPMRPEQEHQSKHDVFDENPTQSQDDFLELRETLESEDLKEQPARKQRFFERLTKRLKHPEEKPADAVPASDEGEIDDARLNQLTPLPMEVENFSEPINFVPEEDDPTAIISSPYADVDFSEPGRLPPAENSDDQWSQEEEAQSTEPAAAEESSQWKSFLATLWKQPEAKESEDVIDDEMLASRVERSLSSESQAEKEWGKPEEASPFMFDQDQPVNNPPAGKKITGPLFMDEEEDIFPEGDGNIWGGLRQELQDTEEEIILEEVTESNLVEEDYPISNAIVTEWEKDEADQGQDPDPDPEIPLLAQINVFEGEEALYESKPFSQEYAHLFGESPAEEVPPEPELEPTVQEIRTIVMEDYEESGDEVSARGGGKKSTRWIRTVLFVLIGAGIITILVLVSLPSIMRWIQPPAPAAAIVSPTSIPMDGMPYPTGIKMTGGWFFFLQPSTIKEGRWEPETSEWLDGSELRRIVALPWTRQLEAVVQSLVPGDTMELQMSNGDILTYLVEATNQVDRDDISILSSNQPSLALVLFQDDTEKRWVVISNLNE
jgi:hypothetical protein